MYATGVYLGFQIFLLNICLYPQSFDALLLFYCSFDVTFEITDARKSITTEYGEFYFDSSRYILYISYNTVELYSRDRYEIIGLRKSSHSIKQPCSSIYLKKAFAMHQSC